MYLELPVCLPGSQEEQLQDKVVPGRFLPAQIVAYHESYFNSQIMIYLANGQPFLIDLSVEAYEGKIKAYWDLVARHQNRKAESQNIKQKLGIRN